jgi:hypothetical protein
MKTNLTITTITFSIFIAIATMLSSCSTSTQLSSQSPHYHLNLVKANPHSMPPDKKENDNATSDIAPLSHHSSMVSYQSDEQLNEITGLLKTNMNLVKKEAKKFSPGIYQEIKNINLNKTLQRLAKSNSIKSNNNRSSVNHTDSMGYPGRYFGLFILFLLLSVLFWILAIGSPIFWIFGAISFIAAVVFFILWIVALA